MIDIKNIDALQWQPNNIKPPYKDGVMTIFFKKSVNAKKQMRIKCDLETYNIKYNKLIKL